MTLQKISASVDGGLSGGSRVRRPGSEDQTPTKYFSFCQPDFDADKISAKRVIFNKFSIVVFVL